MKKLVVALMLVLLLGSVAYAERIDVTFKDIKVYVNGVLVDLEDAFGNEVEPFIYNGEVYLPLSAVAESVDMGYSWSGAEMSAYLGVKPGEVQYLMDVCPPYQTDVHYMACTSENGKSLKMGGKEYSNGFTNGFSSSASTLFNLNSQYKELTFTLGHIDGAAMQDVKVQVYLDGRLAKEFEVDAEGLPRTYTINLNYALSMKIVVDRYAKVCGIADLIVK